MKTAALVIIGDEILTGKVKDDNTIVFAALMFEQGVRVRQIEVIPDEIPIIASTVKRLSQTYDYVCTSGGVGPTHDDLTLDGIAEAFALPLKEHPEALEYFRQAHIEAGRGPELNSAQLKMLTFPDPCQLYFVSASWLPLVQVKNIYILPGVPRLFNMLISAHKQLFQGGKFYRQLIYTDLSESSIADNLGQIAASMPELNIGSYPQSPGQSYNVMISIEGEDQTQVGLASERLLPLIKARLEP